MAQREVYTGAGQIVRGSMHGTPIVNVRGPQAGEHPHAVLTVNLIGAGRRALRCESRGDGFCVRIFVSANRHCQINVVTATLGDVSAPKASGRCHDVPRHERARAQKSLMAGAKPMSSNGE